MWAQGSYFIYLYIVFLQHFFHSEQNCFLLEQTVSNEDLAICWLDFSDSSWQYCPDTGRITGAYIIFYQSGPIDHGIYVPGPVYQSSSESEYNASCTAGMDLSHFRILIHELLNKDPHIVQEEAPLIILDSKSTVFVAKNGKDTKHISHIARGVNF